MTGAAAADEQPVTEQPTAQHPGQVIPRGGGAVTQHPWPSDCRVQAGLHGVVFSSDRTKPAYTTAFFEAFPRNPDTFLRGEGATVEEAEARAWARHVRSANCAGHEYETRGYRNGAGFCRHCDLFSSGVFDLAEIGSVCVVCGVGTYWSTVDGALYCEQHVPREPCPGCGEPLARSERWLHCCPAETTASDAEAQTVSEEALAAVLGSLDRRRAE